jgi:hypothetical protein
MALTEVNCSRVQFMPGDRVIVRSRHQLTPQETDKLRKMVERWAGPNIEVLVVDLTKMELIVEQSR